jgi:hypothetical protein
MIIDEWIGAQLVELCVSFQWFPAGTMIEMDEVNRDVNHAMDDKI